MERDVMLTGGSTAARGEGEEDEGNVLPLVSRNNSHCLWTKKICRIWQCGLFKTARLPRSWLHVLRGRGIARICDRICREDRSLRKHPDSQGRIPVRARARTRGLCLSRSPKMTRKIFSSTIELFLVLIYTIYVGLRSNAVRSPLSEADEENLIVNELKNELFLVLISKDVRWTRTRVHAHALSRNFQSWQGKKLNQRTNYSSSSFGWHALDPKRGVCVWEKRLLVVDVSPTPRRYPLPTQPAMYLPKYLPITYPPIYVLIYRSTYYLPTYLCTYRCTYLSSFKAFKDYDMCLHRLPNSVPILYICTMCQIDWLLIGDNCPWPPFWFLLEDFLKIRCIFCMVKYLSFHNSSLALRYSFLNVKWQGQSVTHPLFILGFFFWGKI